MLAALGYVVSAVLLGMGAARQASLSGELPVYDPTPSEIETWNTGGLFLQVGGIVLLVWSILVLALRKPLRLTIRATVLIIVGGVVASGLTTFIVWMIVLPPLPQG
ncbi:hypothetical protein [Microbacterium luticocti]|uniref:hypothetical protein n=1 Tax=Microbacterium luticocti TaxID=451764 RepID=UPI00048DA90B|nr:hypothetical protein [Microbacterium luticocti]